MRTRSAASVLAISAALAVASGASADRYALLVAIDDYQPAGPSRRDLPGVENDLELMRQTLVRNYGYAADEKHLVVVAGVDATRAAILDAFERLIARVQPSDQFLFYYSGHGSTILDENGDEPDGCDEVLVASDAEPIVDDELGTLLGRVKGRKVVILDSCFSGTATRAIALHTQGKSTTIAGQVVRSGAPEPGSGLAELSAAGLDHVLIAGCQSNQESNVIHLTQPARDGRPREWRISALTYYLCEGLRGRADADRDGFVSYREAADYARVRINEKFSPAKRPSDLPSVTAVVAGQNVQLEGGRVDQPVFGVKRPAALQPRLSRSGGHTQIDVGAAHGFGVGSTFEIDGETRVEIEELGLFASRVKIVDGGGARLGDGAAAIPVAEPLAVPEALTVFFAAPESGQNPAAALALLIDELRSESFLNVTGAGAASADVVVRLHCDGGHVGFELIHPGGRVETGEQVAGDDFGALVHPIRERLATTYAVMLLAALHNEQAGFSVDITTDRGRSNPEYRVGERMQLTVTTTRPCCVTLIDIGTSGRLSVLYPPPGTDPPRLLPDRPLVLPSGGAYIRVDGPPGLDRIKVIATEKPLPLSDFVRTAGAGETRPRRVEEIVRALRRLAQPDAASGEAKLPCDQWSETAIGIIIRQ